MRGDRQVEQMRVEIARLGELVSEMGRLMASMRGAVLLPGDTPQTPGEGTQPPYVSNPETEAAIDRYIKDWREKQGAED